MTETLADQPAQSPPSPEAQPVQPAEQAAWPIEARFAAWVIMGAGAIFRICKWAHWRSLWLDELYLCHSILTRGFWDLLTQPLRYWQASPSGFLVLERICVDLMGGGERVLRLPSLLAGLASLPLFYAVVRRVLAVRPALMALALFASLTPLIYYSQEAKQYSGDVAVNLAVLLAALNLWQKGPGRRTLIWYTAVSGIGFFFSHPAAFVVAGSGIALLVGGIIRVGRRGEAAAGWIGGLLASGAILAAVEFLNYWVFLRPTLTSDARAGLIRYWSQPENDGFIARGPHEVLPWLWKAFWRLVHEPATMNINSAGLAMMAAIVGAGALMTGRRPMAVWLTLSPIPFALLASAVRLYPLADRLALYLVPALVILIAAGIDWLWGEQGMGRALVAMLMLLMIGGGAVMHDMDEIYERNGREETEEVYKWVRDRWQPGDLLFLGNNAAPSFDYYAPKVGPGGLTQLWAANLPDPSTQLEATRNGLEFNAGYHKAYQPKPGKGPPSDVEGFVYVQPDPSSHLPAYQSNMDSYRAKYLDDVANVCHPPAGWHWPPVRRIWVVYSHTWDKTGFQPDTICLPEFERQAERVIEDEEMGASAYLYEVNPRPTHP